MTDDCMGCRVPGYSHAAYCPEGRVDDLRSRLAEVDAALGAWGRNEAGDAATIIRIAKAVGATESTTPRENERE